jgi:hypothetical protein
MAWFHRLDQRPRSGEEAFDSNAEQALFIHIQMNAPHLLTGLRTQYPIPFDHPIMHKGREITGTVPDFAWFNPQPCNAVVYLDGIDVHKDVTKDQLIWHAVRRQGWEVLRWRYHGKIPQKDMAEIVRWVDEKQSDSCEKRRSL